MTELPSYASRGEEEITWMESLKKAGEYNLLIANQKLVLTVRFSLTLSTFRKSKMRPYV